MTEIKICGLFRECDIAYVNAAKPDYAGFILHFPKSHRNVDLAEAYKLRKRLHPAIKVVGVFVDQPLETVIQASEEIGLDIAQLHGTEDENYLQSLRRKRKIPIWKAFRIKSEADLDRAATSSADEVLVDNGYGTGASFDWRYMEGFQRPFILAGGMTPENIPEAIRLLHPKVVDISSGVETGKVKDSEKIMEAVRICHGIC